MLVCERGRPRPHVFRARSGCGSQLLLPEAPRSLSWPLGRRTEGTPCRPMATEPGGRLSAHWSWRGQPLPAWSRIGAVTERFLQRVTGHRGATRHAVASAECLSRVRGQPRQGRAHRRLLGLAGEQGAPPNPERESERARAGNAKNQGGRRDRSHRRSGRTGRLDSPEVTRGQRWTSQPHSHRPPTCPGS